MAQPQPSKTGVSRSFPPPDRAAIPFPVYPPHFGDALRCARERAGLTQAALAIRAGRMQSSHISRLESGTLRRPQAPTLTRLIAALGLPLAEAVALAATVGYSWDAAAGACRRSAPLPSPVCASTVALAQLRSLVVGYCLGQIAFERLRAAVGLPPQPAPWGGAHVR